MISNYEKINQFCSYFQNNINEIEKLNNPLYKKILIVTLLDTLSRVWTEGKEHRNKLRFITFFRECIKWEHADRISIPMIVYRIREEIFKGNDQLNKKFVGLFNGFRDGRILRIDIDPFFNEIEHLVESAKEKKILENSRHVELLYTYRNNLIHEFRIPGHGMEFSNDNETPYYHGMENLDTKMETLELVYPTKIFMNIAYNALTATKAFLILNNFDPFSFYKFGSPW